MFFLNRDLISKMKAKVLDGSQGAPWPNPCGRPTTFLSTCEFYRTWSFHSFFRTFCVVPLHLIAIFDFWMQNPYSPTNYGLSPNYPSISLVISFVPNEFAYTPPDSSTANIVHTYLSYTELCWSSRGLTHSCNCKVQSSSYDRCSVSAYWIQARSGKGEELTPP